MASRIVGGLSSRLGGLSSRPSTRLYRMLWRKRGALPEAGIVLLLRFPVTVPRRRRSSFRSLIDSDSILWTPEQSLRRGGNSLDLPFTALIRRKKNFRSG